MGLISDYLEYRRLKKYYKRLIIWEHQMMEAGLPSIPPDFIPEQKGNEMNNKQARYLHQMLDRLAEGKNLSPEEITLLRKELPELPKQKTLEEIAWDIDFAWAETSGNDWRDEMFGDLETWLSEQHTQLRAHLEGVKSQDHPEFLGTEADYESAPEGTVVAYERSVPFIKWNSNWQTIMADDKPSAAKMGRTRRRVLRWGWGE